MMINMTSLFKSALNSTGSIFPIASFSFLERHRLSITSCWWKVGGADRFWLHWAGNDDDRGNVYNFILPHKVSSVDLIRYTFLLLLPIILMPLDAFRPARLSQ